ncbi:MULTISPECIES: hypothetical protein [Pantoea]|jgi:hypothetical protein|uniref:Lipoprotein n=1 Tax=Pantoea brenneri TaxID=472694 RepID=A0A7Y6TTQ1_9GAMM|nr:MULTISPECIES: hypothetical protein [Pantoea]MBZ6397050.1 hypothetical protein [Pantoea sp.]MBZ6440199.1 hypothetical protein [Pantoea sp.]NUY43439.1 hypothetical protein [Pantoea brenneri]NUY50995.1 hypothetical protein [Pantoea brenneri]NUY61274.1 hypothetical protein [Pantoea brenneri]
MCKSLPYILTLCVALTLLGIVTACTPKTVSLQTQSIAPTIQCKEAEPDEVLLPYPGIEDTRDPDLLLAHIRALNLWAIDTSGKFRAERVMRAGTRNCLNTLRTRGLIN